MPGAAGARIRRVAAIRSPFLTIFWRCDFAPNSSRTGRERRSSQPGVNGFARRFASKGLAMLIRGEMIEIQGQAAISRGSGSILPASAAHPASRRASASYRPLRAVWAVCAWALRGLTTAHRETLLRSAEIAHRPKGSKQMTSANKVRKGPRRYIRHHLARRRTMPRRHHDV